MSRKMRTILIRIMYLLSTHGWTIIFILLAILYVGGYMTMDWFSEKEITDNYTWWFMVTITTVGYGDISPTSYGGQWTAIIIMVLGIGALALIIGKIAEGVISMSEKRSNGLLQLKEKDHIVIMGYRKDITHKLVDEILGDSERLEQSIVLCSTNLEKDPFMETEKVKFIKGSDLASQDVLDRACVNKADKIIIHGSSDDQSFFTAYSVRQVNSHAHLVVFMKNEDHQDKVQRLAADHKDLNQVILPSSVYLMVQEIQDPQASHVLQHLMSNLNGATLYRVNIPDNIDKKWLFSEIFINFRKILNVTILAIKNGEIIANPPMDMQIEPGMAIFYIGGKRLNNILWNEI